MKNEKTLKVFTIISCIYSLYKIVSLVYRYFIVEMDMTSPLIPKYLIDYARFPIYILAPFFIGIFIYTCSLLRSKKYKPIMLILFFIMVVYSIFEGYIYQFINSFNPYG